MAGAPTRAVFAAPPSVRHRSPGRGLGGRGYIHDCANSRPATTTETPAATAASLADRAGVALRLPALPRHPVGAAQLHDVWDRQQTGANPGLPEHPRLGRDDAACRLSVLDLVAAAHGPVLPAYRAHRRLARP